MEKIVLGKTGLSVCRTGFGALPIQRTDTNSAINILRKAYENGIDFYDTARGYSDSEEKIGLALSSVRKNIVIATKSSARSKTDLADHIETSLKKLKTDYIDIMQLHNPDKLPDISDPDDTYCCLIEYKKKGLIRFIGVSCHSLDTAVKAVESGAYDTIQFPLNSLSSEKDLSLSALCKQNNCGLIAMKALSGGLITKPAASFAFLRSYGNILPIWGIQRESELDEFIALEKEPPVMNDHSREIIRKDREELSGSFCRSCGYCLPCHADIQITMSARMSLLLRRMPVTNFMNSDWLEKMLRIRNCDKCGECAKKCPYGLDTPSLLEKNLQDYIQFYKSYHKEKEKTL